MPTLATLKHGQPAIVEDVGCGPLARRLMALGFVPGTRVQLVRIAPLGDPIELELRGTRIAIRRTDADHIRIRHIP